MILDGLGVGVGRDGAPKKSWKAAANRIMARRRARTRVVPGLTDRLGG
jgi:hypothetical protein